MAISDEKAEAARVESIKKQAESDRAREEARRKAHREASKRALAESLIVHSPART